MVTKLLTALALVFIIEGLLPFISPPLYRRYLQMLQGSDDTALRASGAICLAIGVVLMLLVT